MHINAVDPGKTLAVASLCGDQLNFVQDEPYAVYEAIKGDARHCKIDALVIERYWLYPWAVKQGFDELPAPQAIGVLKYLAHTESGIRELVIQNASVMKSALTMARARGIEPVFGDAFQKRTKNKDKSAAEMHLLWYLLRHGFVPQVWQEGEIQWAK